ncbi:MAG: MiaB/RimO family radical SAM methylthiotransferase [Candidatus Ratteibacteria bacterium]|nr:MiaB/RimO family radical SAM methylthiotransferase [Candidatus Ratteibacteria bacterium]
MKLFIKTYGCKANQYDSQLLYENFILEGYEITPFGEAEVVVVNTCCVTGKAEKEARSFISKVAAEGKDVWVTGCAVKRDAFVKQIAGVKVLSDIPFKKKIITSFYNHTRAFVKIENGCENFCAYCIVPYVRGKVKSRPEYEIVEEVRTLCENGYKEIVLTGIDTGVYGKDTGTGIIKLLEKLKYIHGLKRVRLSSIELTYLTDVLCDYLVSSELFCPHLHIPLQSGSDKILKLMGRRYAFSDYANKIEKIRKKDIENRFTFTTDIMVGFPYEDDDDFSLSVKAVEDIGFLKVHIFRYSRREGTSAYSIGGDVPERIKKEREKALKEIVCKVSMDVKRQFIGMSLDVLVERKKDNWWEGYSSQYLPVKVPARCGCLLNEIVYVEIEGMDRCGILHGRMM